MWWAGVASSVKKKQYSAKLMSPSPSVSANLKKSVTSCTTARRRARSAYIPTPIPSHFYPVQVKHVSSC